MHHVGQPGAAGVQQALDVVERAAELAQHVAGVHHAAPMVDAGGTRDEVVGTVGVADAGAAFEGHAVVVSGAQQVEVVQVSDLLRQQAEHGVGVHRHHLVAAAAGTFDAGAGDGVGVAGQAVAGEEGGAAVHQVLVEHIDVLDVQPGPHAVRGQCAALAGQRIHQLLEHRRRFVEARNAVFAATAA